MLTKKSGIPVIITMILMCCFILGTNAEVFAASKLPAPGGITASAASQTQINLKWKSVPGAASYNIYRCNSGPNDDYVKIASGIKNLSYADSRNILSGAPYWYKLSCNGPNGEGPKSSCIKVNSKGPTRAEIINYITAQCQEKNIPALLGLATAWTESAGFNQFTADGNFKISGDGGIGMMQITNKKLDNYTRFKLMQDWKYNVEYGVGSLADAYAYVNKYGNKKKDLDTAEHMARATYSVYNAGKNISSISRWRDKNDKRDKNFYRNYTAKPWQ